jgi:glycerate kinase
MLGISAIPQRALVVSGPFGGDLTAARVLAALARGLQAGGRPGADLCSLDDTDAQRGDVRKLLDRLDFDVRMRAARAVIVGAPRLNERTLAGSATFEIATRARQGGVPAYAVTGEDALNGFDARMLDLQLVLQAPTTRALAGAGRKLAKVM